MELIAAPLTATAFADFGEVVEAPREGRAIFSDGLSLGDKPVVLSTTRAQPVASPIQIEQLERHPYSSQTFLPLDVSRWLVVVSLTLDSSAVKAFVAGPGVGVTLARGVWHHGLTVLDRPAAFAVLMAKDGISDDEFETVRPFSVGVAP